MWGEVCGMGVGCHGSLGSTFPPNPHGSTNPEALQTPHHRYFLEASSRSRPWPLTPFPAPPPRGFPLGT